MDGSVITLSNDEMWYAITDYVNRHYGVDMAYADIDLLLDDDGDIVGCEVQINGTSGE